MAIDAARGPERRLWVGLGLRDDELAMVNSSLALSELGPRVEERRKSERRNSEGS